MATDEKSVPVEPVGNPTDDALENATVSPSAPETATEEVLNEESAPAKEEKKESLSVENEELPEEERLDFSDEEAALAAEASDVDLGEAPQEEEETAMEQSAATEGDGLDLSGLGKAELVDLFHRLLAEKPIQTLRRDAEAIKVAFYKIHRAETEAARRAFLDAGGDPETFVPEPDEQEQRLKEQIGEYRRLRDEFIATLEQSKEVNLQKKLAVIEELKTLIGSNETLNHTFNAFRELQQRWKEIGPVPQANVKDLWETYNLYVEQFYNFIKINKELRDLDLKRNYETKVKLCEEAEALVLEPSIVAAFHKLQKLHEEWRETGPVALEFKEQLWERFREASSRINKQHQQYFDAIKEEQKKNLALKTELCEKTEELSAYPHTTRKEWNKASTQLLEIQKVWKTIGFAPKKDNTKIYERFRTACDRFFEAKRTFYLQFKEEMEHNLQLKNEICEAAEAIQESDEWKKTSDELIALQKRWKEIGPVPRRNSDAVWKRFRAACDHFFERKNAHFSELDNEHKANLEKKLTLLDEMEAFDISQIDFETIKEFQRRWSEIGFVPIKQKETVQKRYKEIVDKFFGTIRGGERERSVDKFRNRISALKGSDDKRLRYERERLYNKVRQLEADIALLENNIGFFSKSKNAEAMINDVKEKIARAKEEMALTIEKVKLIDEQQQ